MSPTLQVQALLNRLGKRTNAGNEDADNNNDGAEKFKHIFLTQQSSPSPGFYDT